MEKQTSHSLPVWIAVIFLGIPLLLYGVGDFPRRSMLKEGISILTLLAFFQMLLQFYMVRYNRYLRDQYSMATVAKFHKIIGYACILVLLAHPFLIVVPRYLEAGVSPEEAFLTMITTASSGVVTGIVSWSLMLTLVVTSCARSRLPLRFNTWRKIHTVLSVALLVLALWHALNLGRHTSVLISMPILVLGFGGILLQLYGNTLQLLGKGKDSKWQTQQELRTCRAEVS